MAKCGEAYGDRGEDEVTELERYLKPLGLPLEADATGWWVSTRREVTTNKWDAQELGPEPDLREPDFLEGWFSWCWRKHDMKCRGVPFRKVYRYQWF